MAEEIIVVIDNLCEKFGIAVDWTAENMIPVIQQLVDKYANYLLWSNVAWLVGSIILFAISVLFTLYEMANDENYVVPGVIGVVFSIGFSAFFVDCIIKAATVPEVYAAQKILEMINAM